MAAVNGGHELSCWQWGKEMKGNLGYDTITFIALKWFIIVQNGVDCCSPASKDCEMKTVRESGIYKAGTQYLVLQPKVNQKYLYSGTNHYKVSRLVFTNINSFKAAGNKSTQDKTVVLNTS